MTTFHLAAIFGVADCWLLWLYVRERRRHKFTKAALTHYHKHAKWVAQR